MFNKDFYPTPSPMIEKLLSDLDLWKIENVLEPSAGKADICDFMKSIRKTNHKEYYDYFNGEKQFKFDVIENDEALQKILTGKGYNLIHDDFLTFQTYKQYDLIIANFPFSDGEYHLEKALKMIDRNGGRLRCFVNAETIKNPHTKLRQWCVDKIQELCGEIEFIENGFKDAERKTNVEVAFISVEVEFEDSSSLILTDLQQAVEIETQDDEVNKVAVANFHEQIVASFQMECKAGEKLISEYFAMKPYILDAIGENAYKKPMISLSIKDGWKDASKREMINSYVKEVRDKYWGIFLEHPSFTRKYTSNVLEDVRRKHREFVSYDFSIFNIRQLEKQLNKQINEGIDKAILNLFDTFSCRYAWTHNPYEKNVHYYNGWATNKAHKINDKIIIPCNGAFGWYSKKELDYHFIRDKFSDMVTVFDTLAMQEYSDTWKLIGNQVEFANNYKEFQIDLRYFDVKFYKKGTCHITFKNKRLLEKLNIYGSRRKAWLPPSYGKKTYEEMNEQEKAVVDEFQGREKYEAVMENSDFYLVELPETLQLQANI